MSETAPANPIHINLFTALSKAQGEIDAALKTAENAAFKKDGKASTYADIAEVIEVIREPALKNGLAVHFDFESRDGGNRIDDFIRYRILHSSGEAFESKWLVMRMRGTSAHDFGAANTYYRRQLLKSIYQIPEEDDDGNKASGAKPEADAKPKAGTTTVKPVGNGKPAEAKDPKGSDPADFIMPVGGATVKGKALKDLKEGALKEILKWAEGELAKNPPVKNIAQVFEIKANVTAFLLSMGVKP